MNDPGPLQDLSLRREIAEQMNIVRSYTHCVLTKTERSIEIGTGVTFRLGGRLFLVTAGHVLKKGFEVYLFTGEGVATQAEVLSSHAHPDTWADGVHADIGFIEVRDIPRVAACAIEQLHIGPAEPHIPENAVLFIAGCPKTGFQPTRRGATMGRLAVFRLHPPADRIAVSSWSQRPGV